MKPRRILSLWFPRLAAERLIRLEPSLGEVPLAVAARTGSADHLASLSQAASEAGLSRGMGLADARAICPDLVTRSANPHHEAAFLAALQRWAGRFSPWVATEGGEALIVDITGCAHLFGGEEGMAAELETDCANFRLTQRIGIADTPGAAWAVARYAGQGASAARSGDAVDQEARATRSRAAKRSKWNRVARTAPATVPRIVPPGQTRAALAPLPIAALRLTDDSHTTLTRLGLHTIGDIARLPRGALARRIGLDALRRLDQAQGAEPEPVSPARPPSHFACRLSLPDPIGLEEDLLAGIDRLLTPLCEALQTKARAARRLRLTAFRADGSWQSVEIGLARPAQEAAHIRPLLALKIKDIDAGYGIDTLRLHAHVTEPYNPTQHRGHFEAAAEARAKADAGGGEDFESLLSRLGARIGLEAMTRYAPAESHIPEKAATVMAAAYSKPVESWPEPATARPLTMFPPEFVTPLDDARPPQSFRWRRREFRRRSATGPERIAPEWWLDDPAWRSGPRDYWRVETQTGERLWLFEARGTGGWFAQGNFG